MGNAVPRGMRGLALDTAEFSLIGPRAVLNGCRVGRERAPARTRDTLIDINLHSRFLLRGHNNHYGTAATL